MSSQNKYISCKKASVNATMTGFALVATLLLMILLSILAMGLLSLSSVSLRNSGNNSSEAEARANARMALMLAIGELQKQMGPDQRISMTADQRMEAGGDGAETIAVAGKRSWTGVFDSWLSTQTDRPTPVFRSWLVSGDKKSLADVEDSSVGDDFIELVGSGTVGETGERVLVPATTVDTPAGPVRLGWWVGDQGVKAALATQPVSKDNSMAVQRNNLQSGGRIAVELAAIGTEKPFASLVDDDPRLPFLTNWNQAEFFASETVAHQPLFHDLVAYSTGLITNVRAGGFRKDLSMKMETFTSPPLLSDPANVLYTVQNEEGINFLELWSYYNLYKQLQYGGGGSFTTGGSIPATAPYLRTANSIQGVEDDTWHHYKQPITVNYQTVLSFEAAPAPKDPGKKALFLNMDPVVTLWNPLDVAVDIPPHRSVINTSQIRCWLYVFWVIPYDINVQINGGPVRRCSIMRSVYNKDYDNTNMSIDYNMLRLNAGQVERITLKPGEVMKISQTSNTVATTNGGFGGLDGRKGFNYGGGTHFALIDELGQYVLLEPDDQITYTTAPNNLTSGKDSSGGNIVAGFSSGNSRRWAMTQINLVMGSPWWPEAGRAEIGHISVDSCYGYRRLKVGQTSNGSSNKTAANSTRTYANNSQFSDFFPVIEGVEDTRELSVAQIESSKAPFMVHSYSVKTEVENQTGTRVFSRFNPKVQQVDFYNLQEAERDLLPYQTEMTPLTSWLNAPLDVSTNGQGFFGSSLASQFGSSFVNTHSIPRQPLISLAAFQDSFANGFNNLKVIKGSQFDDAPRPLLPQVSHAIGNSLAPSVIGPDKTEGNLASNPNPLADHSYLANRALWDDWFLSGIAPQPAPAFPTALDQKTVATEFFSGNMKLPVARYMPSEVREDPTDLIESLFSGTIPTSEAVANVASHLRVDGMFNVNSSSVEAWKTVLGAIKGSQIVVRDESGVESISAADDLTPIAAVGAVRDVPTTDNGAMTKDQWFGRRTLSDAEISALAEAIVKEVRLRGPFLSLSDFVNRRPGTDIALAKAGAIQSALDSTAAEVNQDQINDRSVPSTVASRFPFPEAEEGPIHYGAPSIVKQGDILTPIAPILSARSDSFIIRAYGEAKDASGNQVARAWCEAVVERNSDYVDFADEPEVLPAVLSSDANKEFGRRFNIVSFRWLNPNSI